MQQLANRQIILGISGGIAAYKAAELVRQLKQHGAEVRVIMTAGAQAFITPLTLQALSGNPVHTDLLDPEAEAGMGHIELARWADLILIAPASANVIARLAGGAGDDLLTTVCLATTAPIAIAPAMNQGMWNNPQTQANLEILKQRQGKPSLLFFGPASGQQACGDVGFGRLLEPEQLAAMTAAQFDTGKLSGKRVVITAGPTREALDPVRYISNHSSGKMGYAIAQAAIDAGAHTTLISGPVSLSAPQRCHIIEVSSAEQMLQASLDACENCDIFIASAAVADYRPAQAAEQKLKKSADTLHIELVKNPDIVASIAALPDKPFTVGFAAETQNLLDYARRKLEQKNLDMIVANDVSDQRIGFNSDNNAATILTADSELVIGETSKRQLAAQLIEHIAAQLSRYT